MSEEHKGHGVPPYIGDQSLVIDSRLNKLEREREEEKKEEKRYKDQQILFTRLTVIFAALLFFTSLISDIILFQQTRVARDSADAAKSAADTASKTLVEIQKGGTDTHDLAVAAKDQAERMRDQAGATERLARNAELEERATYDLAIANQAVDRPYVGSLGPLEFEPYKEKQVLNLPVASRNFGPVPAENVGTRIRVYMNDMRNELGMLSPKDFEPTTLLPTETGAVTLKFRPENYSQILSGSNLLTLCVTYRYEDSRQKKYSLSQRFDYGIAQFSGNFKAHWVSTGSCQEIYR